MMRLFQVAAISAHMGIEKADYNIWWLAFFDD
jgi:hypothetical protein